MKQMQAQQFALPLLFIVELRAAGTAPRGMGPHRAFGKSHFDLGLAHGLSYQ